MSANDDKRIQSKDLIKTYAYATNKEIIHRKEEIKRSNIIKQYKMINYDDVTIENINNYNSN